ncbi:hypothetical protein [Gordonia westfalica]|uniref:hypothetical protein n=1 Tax=Gordonia westfalica TaxID=158898 RepID=UPI0011144748|nr:hypothetical protein [Gordonia westfalica]
MQFGVELHECGQELGAPIRRQRLESLEQVPVSLLEGRHIPSAIDDVGDRQAQPVQFTHE